MTDRPEFAQPAVRPGPSADLAAAYIELQNLLVERTDVTEFLLEVARLAASVVPESACGITMRRDHDVATIANSDEFAMAVDEIQYGGGQGPCLHALHTGQIVSVPDLAKEDRWGDYRIHALTYGVKSSLSLPLTINGEVRGALNLYSRRAGSFGTDEARHCEAFARQAATALTLVLRNADQVVLEEQLREALATRAVVDQAVGIIMGQRHIDSSEAFNVLRQTSQSRNLKLRDIAAELIEAVTANRPDRPVPSPTLGRHPPLSSYAATAASSWRSRTSVGSLDSTTSDVSVGAESSSGCRSCPRRGRERSREHRRPSNMAILDAAGSTSATAYKRVRPRAKTTLRDKPP